MPFRILMAAFQIYLTSNNVLHYCAEIPHLAFWINNLALISGIPAHSILSLEDFSRKYKSLMNVPGLIWLITQARTS